MQRILLSILFLIFSCEKTTDPQDCAGVSDGDAVEDSCGVCDSDATNDNTLLTGTCDCAGVAGGTAALDDCGVCDSNTSNDCPDCSDDCPDCSDFFTTFFTTYTQSSQQAFYYFNSITINGIAVDSDDWVVAFNGSVCVGAWQWDTSQCNNGVCSAPVMGDDGSHFTDGYMQTGDIPTFKIYDVSEGVIYNATSRDDPWANFGSNIIPILEATTIFISPCQ